MVFDLEVVVRVEVYVVWFVVGDDAEHVLVQQCCDCLWEVVVQVGDGDVW